MGHVVADPAGRGRGVTPTRKGGVARGGGAYGARGRNTTEVRIAVGTAGVPTILPTPRRRALSLTLLLRPFLLGLADEPYQHEKDGRDR